VDTNSRPYPATIRVPEVCRYQQVVQGQVGWSEIRADTTYHRKPSTIPALAKYRSSLLPVRIHNGTPHRGESVSQSGETYPDL
jgi:hypothetical protein